MQVEEEKKKKKKEEKIEEIDKLMTMDLMDGPIWWIEGSALPCPASIYTFRL